MKWKAPALAPVLICAGVICAAGLLELLGEAQPRFNFFQRLEWITYDWRVRQAASALPPVATNLGLVAATDDSIAALLHGRLPYQFGLQWPRQVHGRLINELTRQGAAAVAFDFVFAEQRPDHRPAAVDGKVYGSDEYFAQQLKAAGNVILAAERNVLPDPLFRTNAWTVGDISTYRDVDGILRRARAFTESRNWDPILVAASLELGWGDLENVIPHPRQIVFQSAEGRHYELPLDSSNRFDAEIVTRWMGYTNHLAADERFAPAFTVSRQWQMGIILAARQLGLDLAKAEVDLERGRITLRGPGIVRTIPVDDHGRFMIDWTITEKNPALTTEVIESLLDQFEARRDSARAGEVTNRWAGKLVVVGSTATGNDLTDFGATPLQRETFLASQHWNVANSMLMDRFIRTPGRGGMMLLITGFGILAALLTWNLRTLHAVTAVLCVAGAYIVFATFAFVNWRWAFPVVLPAGVALLTTHITLITWMVRLEQKERRRTKEIFSKIVSPEIVRELLDAERLPLGGARRHLTVFFADVRGFTEITDASFQQADRFAHENQLAGADAERFFDRQAEEVLETVNVYLAAVAAEIKKHGGTLDKYIGDCVMAFWGAPTANPNHARDAVRAAVSAQRAIHDLNEERQSENHRRQTENVSRALRGEPALPLLRILTLGSGINTGAVTVGLMGSDAHLLNYTAFGRDVNLASRLESVSGHARIVVGSATFAALQVNAPELADLCRELPPVHLKGFYQAISCYEVNWRPEGLSEHAARQVTEALLPRNDEPEACV